MPPARSQIIHNNYQLNWIGKQAINLASGSLQLTSTVTYHLSIALLMVRHHKMGVTRINQKEDLNVSTVSSNSYKLNV
jgi:hypothetical protein